MKDPKKTPLKQLVAVKRKEYKQFGPVYCPILKETVQFTFDGFEHLHVDGRKKRRPDGDARARLMLMSYAPGAIVGAKWLYTDKPKIVNGKIAQHYELVTRVGIYSTKVIVTIRKLGDGHTHFYGIRHARQQK